MIKIVFNDKRKDSDYTNADILSFKLINKFAGYNSQILQSRASEDTLFTNFMKASSQSTISRIHKRVKQETIDTFADKNKKFCKSCIDKLDVVILDEDSTNIICHCKQEASTHNPHFFHRFHLFSGSLKMRFQKIVLVPFRHTLVITYARVPIGDR